ncbi:MAG: diguanylate cyclase [Campylobacterota bacterium]
MQKNITKLFYLLTVLSIIFLIIVGSSEYSSYSKEENLQHQKVLATAVYNLDRTDLDLANIQYRGKNTILRHESDTLKSHYNNDVFNKLFKTIDHQQELSQLSNAISTFNDAAGEWYTQEQIEDDQHQANREQFTDTYNTLTEQIDHLLSENALYNTERHNLFITAGGPLLLLTVMIGLLLYRRHQKDEKEAHAAEKKVQRNLYTVQSDQSSKQVEHTIKVPKNINPAYLDEATGINNDKGFIHEYNESKGQHLRNYTAVCLFSVDKLEELEANYPTEFSETILKKVGFMLALYHHDHDIIGRLAHNSFVIILSRGDKASAVNDCELIRKSIEGTPFTTEGGQELTITVSGGFLQKESTQSMNEILAKAKKILAMSIQHGGNRIAQLRDKNTEMK